MKEKKRLKTVGIVATVILLCTICFGVYCLRYYVGTYMRTEDGVNIVLFDNGPVIMSDRMSRDQFEGLQTGDRVLVIHGFLEETYPARSEAKVVFRLGGSSVDTVP